MTAYPSEWETTALLRDGATVEVRPIRAGDRDRLARFHSRQSRESIYFRFFRYRPELSDKELTYFPEVDYDRRMAFVALLEDEIVAVARYEMAEKSEDLSAEVAFFVDDAHHGRGLATLMLEYLAEAGRQRGLTGFTASVLSENYRMLRVFKHAGFEVSTRFDDGHIAVTLGIERNESTAAIIEDRDRQARVRSVEKVFQPTSIAVVGASRRPGSVGHELIASIARSGFAGPVHAVNPATTDPIAGFATVASATEIVDLDLAIIAVSAEQVLLAATDAIEAGASTLLVASTGFSDDPGDEGASREFELLALVRRHGVRLVGPFSYGVINTDPEHRLTCQFLPVPTRPGSIGVLSQSGPLGAAFLDQLYREGLGVSTFLSLGNRADLSTGDVLEYWADDPATTAVALYLENLGNPRKFISTGRRISAVKPVVSVRPADSRRAILAESAGLILVESGAELVDELRLVTTQPVPRGNRVLIVTNVSAVGELCTAACQRAKLEPRIPESLRPLIEAGELAENQHGAVTIPHLAGLEALESIVVRGAVSHEVDSILLSIVPTFELAPGDVSGLISRVDRAVEKPVVAVSLTSETKGDTPTYIYPDSATNALARYVDYGGWRATAHSGELRADAADRLLVQESIEALLGEIEPVDVDAPLVFELGSPEVNGFASEVGLRLLPGHLVGSTADAIVAAENLGWPVAVKASWIARRSPGEEGGTVLDVHDEASLVSALERLGVGPERQVVIQTMAPRGLAVSVLAQQDRSGGARLHLGVGGAVADRLNPLASCVLPATAADVMEAVEQVVQLAEPERSQLRGFVTRVAEIVEASPDVSVLECNPVLVGASHATAVECRVEVQRWDGAPRVRSLA